jgi:XTP/dITP diphosphohydrolase
VKLVLASNNLKKRLELQALLAPLGVQLLPQAELGVAEAEEPHVTFLENALAKARHAARATGLPALADDSGLCVDALGGEPGVQSAVYAPAPPAPADREQHRALQDAANNALLLQRLAALGDRRARFVCTLVALRHAADPQPLVAFGAWEGAILPAQRGQGGFGYDPLMFIPALGATVAELAPDVKNAHSHRALAMQQMLGLLRTQWRIGA